MTGGSAPPSRLDVGDPLLVLPEFDDPEEIERLDPAVEFSALEENAPVAPLVPIAEEGLAVDVLPPPPNEDAPVVLATDA